jgi:hypothetical protein
MDIDFDLLSHWRDAGGYFFFRGGQIGLKSFKNRQKLT